MTRSLLSTRYALKIALCVGLVITACSRDNMTPAGTIAGAMPPVAEVVSATSVTATAANGTVYTTAPDPQTGAFTFFSVPPGTYTLKFVTTATAPDNFPVWVPVKVVAGTTTTPQIPLVTHDGVGRGIMKWTLDGKTYSATTFIKVQGEGKYFNLWGRTGEFGTARQVSDCGIYLPEDDENGKLFAGAGTYILGGPNRTIPVGYHAIYLNNKPELSLTYQSVYYTPAGSMRLTRYDAQAGVAAGTFEFKALARTGVSIPGAPDDLTITNGEFAVTF
ncbi:carboxypeptidase-like regulatory domain-containing protein [Hymenobacter sp. H14-R3]|uniref:carboxypeptidase-like regulatory domain-containing protein n=1 Tax=Hymenobacter sp. H14-R3 TaxID=3046308 RepID=UPI0024BA3C04|nr:carboxypeptidase-like regulatory domain-containing protein [Hymenobacter sp. H14-R3]MDJ0363931.1 carboxypeptidase-like regulatory domain-containing protein [Hymenobacter sp. H14-R3]